jgi:hypothetical protein
MGGRHRRTKAANKTTGGCFTLTKVDYIQQSGENTANKLYKNVNY